MALASIPVTLLAGEGYAALPFLLTAAVSFLLGQLLYRRYRGAQRMQLRHAMVTAVLSWMLVPLVGVVPLFLIAWMIGEDQAGGSVLVLRDFLNAFFEAVSGFTSTGLTMIAHPSELPVSLQWWRSFSQWIGGVGVIVLMLSVFHPSADSHRLYFSEAREKTIMPDIAATVRTTWWIYLAYTLAAVMLLRFTGMGWWHALNYGMTGIATGGFGVTDNSLGDFDVAPRIAMLLIVIVGAISFSTHYNILRKGQFHLLWKDPECHALFLLLLLGALLLALENRWFTGSALWLDSLFQWTSALATAGFGTVRLDTWSPTAQLLLSLAMVCGGAAGATTGGLKLRRVVLLGNAAFARLRGVALHPWRLMEHKAMADDETHAVRALEAAAVMAALWATVILVGTLLLLHAVGPGAALEEVILEVSSALSNVGLTSGIAGPDLHWSGRVGLILIMWMGRLEIVPVLVLLSALFVVSRERLRSSRARKRETKG
ncbi:MAG: TrkH family potassium uptake protein [Gammaproteobacteria bacterium]|nr:TrkH family potassium uptake protein [Gammaproteobacteria bacterium]NIR83536.1 TrkH family potassium uptake protein [Gammaproteobacteria bacterium]NIR91458.1 TrkH family potassium uptake protein [Gammaproteobacteria bacterium]NIU04698.1 TrkH family potassium uptake protein [Gammaproteobacteria bacterium]NIV51740.1 TrkH family potassium uptake protein [Gammaproteobacteria bacterium]